MTEYKFIINKPVEIEETRYYEFKQITGGKPLNTIKNTCDEYVVAFLNSAGGRIFWGIRDFDRFAVGILLTSTERDDLRKIVTGKLNEIKPPISPIAYQINLHSVYEDETCEKTVENRYVVEIVAPHVFSDDMYSTGSGEVYVRTDSGKRKLNFQEIQDEIRRRHIQKNQTEFLSSSTNKELKKCRNESMIASVEDVIEWNWDGITLLDHLIKLDYATISGLTDENEGHSEQWSPVFMEHPDTWRLLIDGVENIVGYWHFVPLFDTEYQLAKEGLLLDGDITADKLSYFELPGFYNIYFVSISILPSYRGVHNFRLLLDSLFQQFTELACRDIYFKEICVNAFTQSGVSLCKTLEMEYIGEHKDKGKLFIQKFHPLPNLRIFQNYPEFVSIYSNLLLK